mmetsp:Transcript_10870/g.17171  ORF Transcript_10870/g.17171 Transcript_10870/m.17171 type:complete len:213 (-) Transcript_10870:77-715(-)
MLQKDPRPNPTSCCPKSDISQRAIHIILAVIVVALIIQTPTNSEELEHHGAVAHIRKEDDKTRGVTEPKRSGTPPTNSEASQATACKQQPRGRYAICIFGGVSRLKPGSVEPAEVWDEKYIITPLRITLRSVLRHVVDPNGGPEAFDLYIHSWMQELREDYHSYLNISQPHLTCTNKNLRVVWEDYENNKPFKSAYHTHNFNHTIWAQVSAN